MIKKITVILLICLLAQRVFGQELAREKAVQSYYGGFETHNWKLASSAFANGFTFTSSNNDDHITLEKFKQKFWPTNRFFKKVKLVRMTGSGHALFLLVEITTTDNKVVRNVDLFNFNGAKIQSIETFFGRGESYPGHKK